MTDRELMQQAMGALRSVQDHRPNDETNNAIAALRKRLAQPEQEPVANNPDPYHLSRILHQLAGAASMCWEHVDRAGVFQSTQAAEFVAEAIDEIRQRMKATPQQHKSLTEEEIEDEWESVTGHNISHGDRQEGRAMYISPDEVTAFARAVIAKVTGEKE